MAKNKTIEDARRNKNDEFYTQESVIAAEMQHYEDHFRGKTVLCNCDDPFVSEFFNYFAWRFGTLQLKEIITTCYKNTRSDRFSDYQSEQGLVLRYNGHPNPKQDCIPKLADIPVQKLQGDGDFSSDECVALMKQADVVVTNPPFSLFRKYVALLIQHDKKFLILGNMNAITYKEIFPLIKQNKLWLGVNNGAKKFAVPDDAEKFHSVEDGKKFMHMGNVVWYTNLPHTRRNEELDLGKRHQETPARYPKYDNYDAINVDKVKEIPGDYSGVMGVPITFLDKYNPDQFEILGFDYDVQQGLLPELVNPNWDGKIDRGYVNGKRLYSRILIKPKKI